jgi:hypothetical protein
LDLPQAWKVLSSVDAATLMVKEDHNVFLDLLDHIELLCLRLFKFVHELRHIAILLVEQLVLLELAVISVVHLILHLLDLLLVVVGRLLELSGSSLKFLDLVVIGFDASEESLASLWEGEVQLISLYLEIPLLPLQRHLLVSQLMRLLLQHVLTKRGVSLQHLLVDVLKDLPLVLDLVLQRLVLLLETDILLPLLGVEIGKPLFRLCVSHSNLSLSVLNLLLHSLTLKE